MVVINLGRTPTNLESAVSAGSSIFRRVAENRRKIEADKRIQELITGARAEGKEVTTSIGRGGGISGVSIKDVLPEQPGFFDLGAPFGVPPSAGTPSTGTRAVSVPGAQTINLAQTLGGARGAPPAAPTITPGAALAPAAAQVAPTVPGGQLRAEELTAKRAGQTLKFKRVKPETEKQQEAEAKAQASLRTAQLKDVEKRKVNLRSSKLKLGNSLRSFKDQARRTEKLTGLKPGPIGGFASLILGKAKINEFVRGFTGGLTEVAAAVGATAIPNARAVRLVSLFKGTGISQFDTIESGIQTTADSIVNGMSGDMAAAPWEYVFGNLPNEKQSKAAWDALTREEQTRIEDQELPRLLEAFEDAFVKEATDTVFDEDPQLLGEETIRRIEAERELQRNTFTTPSGIQFTVGQ